MRQEKEDLSYIDLNQDTLGINESSEREGE
jgi:hypothetical protein